MRLQKWWILLLPLPLLYYPTAVPYAFLLLLMFTYRQIRSRYQTSPARALLAGSAITFVVAGIGLVGLSYLMGLYQPDNYFRAIAYLFSETRRPQVPVALIALAVLLALGLLCRIGRLEPPMIIAIAILAIAAVGSVNLHLVTGFMLSQKNYYDYGLSVLLAVIAVVQIDSLRHPLLKNATLLAVLAAITLYSSRSQAIWYDRAIELSQELSPDIEKVRRDPLRAVFFKTEDAANVAYSTARLLGPISNLYSTREYATQCGGYVRLAKDAITLVKQRFPEKEKQLVRFFNSAAVMEWSGRTNKKSIPDYSYCRNVDLENRDFYLVGPEPP